MSDNKINLEHLNLIQEEFFKGNSISFQENFEGQGLDESSNYLLGCRAGPLLHVSNLIHEMCHLAELEISRLLKKPNFGWGFKYGKFWQIGSAWGYEPATDQSVRREMRAWAYQWSIHQSLQIPCDDEDDSLLNLVRSSKYLHAFNNYKFNVISSEDREKMGYRIAEDRTVEIMSEEVLKLSNNVFTFDNFRKEWKNRMEVLRAA